MRAMLFIPDSVAQAEAIVSTVAEVADVELASMSKSDFMRIWSAVVYLNPGLHTDNYHDPAYVYDCTEVVRSVLAEVWRRSDAGGISDHELYPYEVIQARLMA